MRHLRIGLDLTLPLEWVTLATVVYGARGSGKSTFGRRAAEEAHRLSQRFCAIDLKGDWYGLKSSADGKSAGIPVVVFGGDHADLPLEEGAGAFVAETVAGLSQSTIIDLEHFSKGKQTRFLASFFAALYDANRDNLLLLLDEAQRYAPQGRTFDVDAAKCLGAVEDLVKLGRKHGIGPVLLTQRGSGLNKEVSELCDMLVAFRTPGPLDQARVKDWLDANTTKDQRDTVMGKLSGLPTGTAVFASGHPDLKVFGVHAVTRPETFDSSSTPKPGQKRIVPKALAAPDLEGIRERMADAIERATLDDPKWLRARIAELERGLSVAPEIRHIDRPVFDSAAVDVIHEEAFRRIDDVSAALDRAKFAIGESLKSYKDACRTAATLGERGIATAARETLTEKRERIDRTGSIRDRVGSVPKGSVTRVGPGPSNLPKVERLILTTLAQFVDMPISRERLALLIGYHRNSKSFVNGLGALRGRGAVDGLTITALGFVELGDYERLPTGPALVDWYCHNKLRPAEEHILRALIAGSGRLSREQLAAKVGYHPNAKSFVNGLGRLRGLGIVEGLQLAEHVR